MYTMRCDPQNCLGHPRGVLQTFTVNGRMCRDFPVDDWSCTSACSSAKARREGDKGASANKGNNPLKIESGQYKTICYHDPDKLHAMTTKYSRGDYCHNHYVMRKDSASVAGVGTQADHCSGPAMAPRDSATTPSPTASDNRPLRNSDAEYFRAESSVGRARDSFSTTHAHTIKDSDRVALYGRDPTSAEMAQIPHSSGSEGQHPFGVSRLATLVAHPAHTPQLETFAKADRLRWSFESPALTNRDPRSTCNLWELATKVPISPPRDILSHPRRRIHSRPRTAQAQRILKVNMSGHSEPLE